MELIDILVASVLVLIMFGIGVSLTTKDVSHVVSAPKALIVALCSQMILLPVIAFAICTVLDIPDYIKIGLVILAASPGGTTSGFITYLFRGNTALSVILTSINAFLTIFTIPLIVNFALVHFLGTSTSFKLPFGNTMLQIFILTIIPAGLGILLRARKKDIAEKINKVAKPILILLLGVVFLIKFFGTQGEKGISGEEIIAILPSALLLNILCLLTGYAVARLFKLGDKNEIALTNETAVHNTTMAFLIADVLMQNAQFGKVSLVYAMFSFWTAVIFCAYISKFYKKLSLTWIKMKLKQLRESI